MAFQDTDKILVSRGGVDYQADLGPLMEGIEEIPTESYTNYVRSREDSGAVAIWKELGDVGPTFYAGESGGWEQADDGDVYWHSNIESQYDVKGKNIYADDYVYGDGSRLDNVMPLDLRTLPALP